MRAAITGGSGFLGRHVREAMLERGWEPVVLSRSHSDGQTIITDYSTGDLTEKLKGFDAAAHLAGNRGAGHRIELYHSDQIITQNLYEACMNNGIKNVAFASSISVYSDEQKLPWQELQLPQPASFYGIGKYACELIGDYYSRRNLLNVKNLRLSHMFGANEKNNYMVNLFMRRAFHRMELTLHTASLGKREFLYVKDAARAVLAALEKETLSGTYNIGSADALTNKEVAEKINEVFMNEGNLKILDPEAPDKTPSSSMDHSRARNDLAFSSNRTFKEALEEIYEEMKETGNVPILY